MLQSWSDPALRPFLFRRLLLPPTGSDRHAHRRTRSTANVMDALRRHGRCRAHALFNNHIDMPGTLYLLRSNADPSLHKIGITNHWHQRAKQLEVGLSTACIGRWLVSDSRQLETFLHRRFKAHRLPQSEWFHLSADQVAWATAAASKAADDLKQATNHQPRPAPAVRPPAAAPERPRPLTYQPDQTPLQVAAANRAQRNAQPTPAEDSRQQRQRLNRQRQRYEASLPGWMLAWCAVLFYVGMSVSYSRHGNDAIWDVPRVLVTAPVIAAPLAVVSAAMFVGSD
jgi:hypothetical protein